MVNRASRTRASGAVQGDRPTLRGEIRVRVTFLIPGGLRQFANGKGQIELEVSSPATLRDALDALWKLYPGIRDRVATEQGAVREHINLFVGSENVRYTGGAATPLTEGVEISIVPSISGGR